MYVFYVGSYSLFISMAFSSFVILMYLTYINLDLNNILTKTVYLFAIVSAVFLSYNPSARFQFLGWIIALSLIVFRKRSVNKKILIYGVGGTIAFVFFSLAGVLRLQSNVELSFEDQVELAIGGLREAKDFNFIDGYIMVEEVYPEYLDYQLGMEHFATLLRPIPRAWWPGKPVGAWFNKFTQKYETETIAVGISPTIFGSFYEEGAVPAIVIFSIIYAWFIAKITMAAEKYDSAMQYLIKGILVASLVPLLRGGDIPGIYAFILMSFWPLLVFINRYNKFLKKEKRRMKRAIARQVTMQQNTLQPQS